MADLNTCAVCKMPVDPANAIKETFHEQEYAFCSEGCREQFLVDPNRYVPM